MGVAVLESRELVYWGISSFRMRGKRPVLRAVGARVQALIRSYQPATLAMEAPESFRLASSPLLASIVATIKALAQAEQLPVQSLTPAQIRQRLCGSPQATHADLVERAVAQYPHLERYQNPDSAWQEAYWRPMFVAVGVLLAYAQEGALPRLFSRTPGVFGR